ncbi:hypothetical protein FOQG_15914 [Fusarium oxysporum f. sp. raphani 54005]|uniref:DUF7918 domain-containing protein n=1 Tax=Fusarium oxysporum f. sp. raphani 54005 TaxID=1089458 RepID=X0BCH0_FUSOX|nr:hypothetical protein FOWG_17159 [Fusarium oxysporum f. sp. lycopersici MN25]EXK79486.1 hypothetical protein FOQG_15914 [Fusarium oxysporum f. sp. raphani 54005]
MTEADGSESLQYFVFSDLSSVEVADDHTIKADKKRIRSMGSIDLRISRAQARGRVRFSIPSGRRQATSRAVLTVMKIHDNPD